MKRLTALAAALLLVAGILPAAAQDIGPDDMNRCLCVSALSRILCKKAGEINYVSKAGDGIYVFSVFYASQEARFSCAFTPDVIHVRGDTTKKFLRTIPYTYDQKERCGSFTLGLPDCPIRGAAKCCSAKTAEQSQQEKEDTFWSRPIPEILQEEITTGQFGKDEGAPEAQPTPSEQRPEGR